MRLSLERSRGGFPLDAFLERIGYSGPLTVTADVLESVQRAQLEAIPFENFDILLGRGVSLEPDALVDKLVRSRRGGYCFELNGLLLEALHAIGFEARPLLARVHLSGEPSGRTHVLCLVTLRETHWLADAGFGGPALRAPIPLELDAPRAQESEVYRLVEAAPFGTMLQRRSAGRWQDLYSFDLAHVCPADIAVGNHFTSTHPASHFTYSRIAALQTRKGRVSLRDRTLKRVETTGEAVEEIPEGEEYIAALEQNFGIALEVPYAALRPLT